MNSTIAERRSVRRELEGLRREMDEQSNHLYAEHDLTFRETGDFALQHQAVAFEQAVAMIDTRLAAIGDDDE